MKRLTTWLVALALALSGAVAPAQLAMTGAGKNPAVAGGGSVAFDSAVSYSEEDSTTPTSTDAWTIASTSNRWAIGALLSRDFGTPATHSGMTLEGVSMTQLGSTADIEADTTALVSRWNLTAPAAGSSMTLVGTLSIQQGVGEVVGAVYNGVHQTTPINSTPTATEGAWDGVTEVTPHPSITGTTVTGGKLIAILGFNTSTGGPPSSITGTGVTVRAEAHQNGNSLYLLEKDDTSGSTTIDLTITFGASSTGVWRIDAYAVQPQ